MKTDQSSTVQPLTLGGSAYVVVPREEFERLTRLAKAAEFPPLPPQDAHGNYPAGEYMRASIARSIVRDRAKLGLSQAELARRAGLRVETLCRIEGGKHTPTVASIEKIDRALKRAAAEGVRSSRTRRR